GSSGVAENSTQERFEYLQVCIFKVGHHSQRTISPRWFVITFKVDDSFSFTVNKKVDVKFIQGCVPLIFSGNVTHQKIFEFQILDKNIILYRRHLVVVTEIN